MSADGHLEPLGVAAKDSSGGKSPCGDAVLHLQFSVKADTRLFGIAFLEVARGELEQTTANRQTCHQRYPGPDHATKGHGENCAHLEGATFDNMQT